MRKLRDELIASGLVRATIPAGTFQINNSIRGANVEETNALQITIPGESRLLFASRSWLELFAFSGIDAFVKSLLLISRNNSDDAASFSNLDGRILRGKERVECFKCKKAQNTARKDHCSRVLVNFMNHLLILFQIADCKSSIYSSIEHFSTFKRKILSSIIDNVKQRPKVKYREKRIGESFRAG